MSPHENVPLRRNLFRALIPYIASHLRRELDWAARYRQADPEAHRARQRAYSERMMAADPTWRVKTHLQASWKGRLRRKGIYHSKGFLELLGMPWPEFAARLERQLKRGDSDWSDFGVKFWIDHKIPLSAFSLKKFEERAMATHWSNLQPPPADWNRAKNGYFSTDELRAFKSYWRANYGPRSRQLEFDDNWPIPNELRRRKTSSYWVIPALPLAR